MHDLDDEAERATAMLYGRTVVRVLRHRASEVGVLFTDGARLFVDASGGAAELSIAGGGDDRAVQGPAEPETDRQSEPSNVALLTPPHNYAVVRLPDRRFPGVVFQGDSLSALCERLGNAVNGDLDELASVKSDLDDVLRSYLATLHQHSIEPPFAYRPSR